MSTAPALQTPPPAASPPPGEVVALRRKGGGEGGDAAERNAYRARLGIWITLVPVAMLFFAFASAYVVRRGLGDGWAPVVLPTLVWINTIVLLASSATLELGRRELKRGGTGAAWVWGTLGLGVLFLAGQVACWMQLTAVGIDVKATPYSSFFYVLTGAHAVHLAGGVLALLAAALWPQEGWKVTRGAAVQITAIYWHFMDILWVGILFLLVFWR